MRRILAAPPLVDRALGWREGEPDVAVQPLLLRVWAERWRQYGASADEVQTTLGKILQGADPPRSEAAVQRLLHEPGFGAAQRVFGSLFRGAWVTHRQA